MSRHLTIDFGNTQAKAAIFDGEKCLDLYYGIDHMQLIKLANSDLDAKIMMCSVSQEATHIVNLIENKARILKLDFKTSIPVQNGYGSPETLGMDRLAAVIGANYLYPNVDCLVIDAGTCLTFDFIDSNAKYLGGSISLGIQMRFKALSHFTSKLPFVGSKTDESFDLVGKNTQEAILSGVLNGIVSEVEAIIMNYKARYANINALLCGGDHSFFESRIKHPIFAHPELVLLGLNRILLHNAN
ncbi:MAG: type III pantothenate kinase [Cytophagales bacterium]